MPLPNQIHQDKALENISVAYKPNEFIADMFVPKVPVKHETDKYYVFDLDILNMPESIRANGAESKRAFYNVSTSSYKLTEHALHDYVTQRDRNNADKAIQPDIDTTEILTQKILIRREYECQQVAQTKANWANNESLSSTFAWNLNTTLSNPLTKVDSATSKIIASSGFIPNKLVIDDPTYRGLRVHDQITDRIKYTTAESISEKMLAGLFDVEQLLVARAISDTSEEGLAGDAGFMWTDTAVLAYMAPSAGLRRPSAMYQLMQPQGGSPMKISKWNEPKRGENTIAIEASSLFQFKAVATACAFLIIDTIV